MTWLQQDLTEIKERLGRIEDRLYHVEMELARQRGAWQIINMIGRPIVLGGIGSLLTILLSKWLV